MKRTLAASVSVGALALALSVAPRPAEAQSGGFTVLPSGCGSGSVHGTTSATQTTTGKVCVDATVTVGNVTATNPSVAVTGIAVPGNATYIAGINPSGNLAGVATDASGHLLANVTNTVTITGSISAINPSVSLTGTAVPGNGTFVGIQNPAGNMVAAHGDTAGDILANITAGCVTETNSASILTAVQGAVPAGTNVIGALVANQTVQVTDGSNYANRSNWVGNTTTVANTTAATVIPAPGAGLSIFVTDYDCANTSTSANVTVTFNDVAGTVLPLPALGGVVHALRTPREVAGNTALTMTASANATSVTCTASGYKATT